MREIVLDTETTGLDPAKGSRIVELACLELKHHMPTGQVWREYINPECTMPEEARAIHGLDDDFLADKPLFAQVADAFLEFIGEDPLVIHNAKFDIGFLNAELQRLEKPLITLDRAVDTMLLARRRFPGAQASLDALCKRFEIDNSARNFHGALLDCELLAEVYLELRGGRQPGFELKTEKTAASVLRGVQRQPRAPRPHDASEAELKRHEAMVAELTDPVWKA